MKKLFIGIAALFAVLGLVHLGLSPMNKNLHGALVQQRKDLKPLNELRDLRLEDEAQQRRDLKKYQWTNKRREHARIPITRAFDYYLGTP